MLCWDAAALLVVGSAAANRAVFAVAHSALEAAPSVNLLGQASVEFVLLAVEMMLLLLLLAAPPVAWADLA